MNTLHFWFSSGNYSLLAHLDDSGQRQGDVGVVIVPPFGWEDVCSYRPLRFVGQALAGMGIPTLRYDLPGTGDSSGDANDPGLFDAWIQSVDRAAAELRNAAGVTDIAVVGIHLGAMLALTAASRGANLHQLVLWGPAACGRTVLRELRAFANMERWEYLADQDAPPQPLAGFAAGGFLIAPETLSALDALDVSALPLPRHGRILLMSRDNLPHDSRLVAALPTVELAVGRGYSAMMASPQESQFPEDTCRTIAEFLLRDRLKPWVSGLQPALLRLSTSFEPGTTGQGISERIFAIKTAIKSAIKPSSSEMFGILAEPGAGITRSDYCLLYLNAGGVRHTGPNRMWVESARRWASQGVVSLRFDVQGIGESDGEQCLDVPDLYRDRLMAQIDTALNSLRSSGIKQFIAIGLCSGACWAFHTALRNPDVGAAILVNPSLLYWEAGADRRRMLRSVANGVSGRANWTKMIRAGMQRGDVRQGMRRMAEAFGRRTKVSGFLQLGFETVSQAWSSLEQSCKRVTLVFREGEPLLAEMEASAQLPPEGNSFTRCLRVPNGGHTLRPLWAQKLVHDLIDAELSGTIRARYRLDDSRGIGADASCAGGAAK
jgi:pimeloyl-ACP methyl ester carboxylesterase